MIELTIFDNFEVEINRYQGDKPIKGCNFPNWQSFLVHLDRSPKFLNYLSNTELIIYDHSKHDNEIIPAILENFIQEYHLHRNTFYHWCGDANYV